MHCYLCGSENSSKIGITRDTEVNVFRCECGLVFLEKYEYGNMYIDNSKGSNRIRAQAQDDNRRLEFLRQVITNKVVLDFGCGVGGFMKLAESICDISGLDRVNCAYKKIYSDISELPHKYDVITMFQSLEHFPDPRKTLKELSSVLNPGGKIIIEIPNIDDALRTMFKCHDFIKWGLWGHHPFMYNADTLKELIKQSGYLIDYLCFIQRWPLSNTLHWIAFGKPDGHKRWYFLDSPKLHSEYEKALADKCDTIMAQIYV